MKLKTRHTQKEIAKRVGVTQPTVSNWLNGTVRPQGLSRDALKREYPDLFKRIEELWKV